MEWGLAKALRAWVTQVSLSQLPHHPLTMTASLAASQFCVYPHVASMHGNITNILKDSNFMFAVCKIPKL